MKPTVLIPIMPGTNCHHETAAAFELAGAVAKVKPLKSFRPGELSGCDLLALAGGFSWGDHFGSGHIAALDLEHRFADDLQAVREKKIPVLGICNGFQILVSLKLLPGALDFNKQGQFEHRHDVTVVLHEPVHGGVWTYGLAGRELHLPVGHGEGRLVGAATFNVAATYGNAAGDATYPASPNGSPIAGICDDTGRIMGMMPHPERRVVRDLRGNNDGLAIFQAGVNAVKG